MTGLSRSAGESNLPPGVKPLAVDLRDSESVSAHLGVSRYDLVYHLAGYVSARQDRELVAPMLEANLLTTVNLLGAVSAIGCGRLIMVGSSEEPEVGSDRAPSSPYAAAKAAARTYALMYHGLYGLPVVALRLFLAYGPRQSRTKLVPYTVCTLLDDRSPSLSGGEKMCDAIFVDDAVRCMLRAAVAPGDAEGMTFDLGSGVGISVRELVTRVAELIDSPGSPEFGRLPDRKAESGQTADLERTRAVLGWKPVWSLRDGLRETIEWYRRELVGEVIR